MSRKKYSNNNISLWSLAWDLGWLIAIPVVLLAIGGALLDKKFATSPWFLLIGIGLALLITSVAVYRKVIKIFNDLGQIEKKK